MWLRSTFLRLALAIALLCVVASCAAFASLFVLMRASFEAEARASLVADLAWLDDIARAQGLAGLRAAIERRIQANAFDGSFYLLAGPDGSTIVGSLPHWPEGGPGDRRPAVFALALPGRPPVRAMGVALDLKNGDRILAVRALTAEEDLLTAALRLGAVAIAVVALLGLAGGVLVARRVTGRIERINRTCREIEGGELTMRVPDADRNDEFGRLSRHINSMLDRIADLVGRLRIVTARVAHEMRTPLARLRARLDEAESATADPATAENLAEAIGEIDGMLRLFETVLDLGALEARRGSPGGLAPVDAAAVVAEVAALYDAFADERGVKLAVAADGPAVVRAERPLLFRLVANLVDNAVKFSPPGGTVTLSCREADGAYRIDVTDEGPGFSPELAEGTFEPFLRGANAKGWPGHGLGLSLARAIALRHGFELAVLRRQGGAHVRVAMPKDAPQTLARRPEMIDAT